MKRTGWTGKRVNEANGFSLCPNTQRQFCEKNKDCMRSVVRGYKCCRKLTIEVRRAKQ